MISGFLTSRYQFPPTTPAYRERLTLIIDFYHLPPGFFSSEAFIKRTNRVSTDAASR